jgi:pyruvate/2-oxoglutarate dehydrogenase complex dihydrolipoamide acyltransferase (E2) component
MGDSRNGREGEANISPLAKRLAEQNGVDWRKLSGSGPGGRVTERDVIEHLAHAAEEGGHARDVAAQEAGDYGDYGEDDEEALLVIEEEPAQEGEFALDFAEEQASEGEGEFLLELDDLSAAAKPQPDLPEERPLFEGGNDETALAADNTGASAEAVAPEEESLLARGHDHEAEVRLDKDEPDIFRDREREEAALLRDLPLASPGLFLRNHIELTPLIEAQAAVGRSLGREVSLAAFLVRAAARALESQPLASDKRVALAILTESGLGVKAVPEADGASFAQLLEQVAELSASSELARDEADLLVADMSAYGIDEAVLNAGLPVLTLGRILVNSKSGQRHSTLSLSGDLPPAKAARFLSQVTELIGSPIELVI